jgi:RNA polymerase sigma-70 factor (ECF subfamily)
VKREGSVPVPPSDQELVALVVAVSDRDAFGELVRRHQGVVRGMLGRLTRNRALADDIAQDAFLRAFRKMGGYRGEGSFKSWLCRIAYTEFLQAHRKRKAVARVMDELGAARGEEAASGADPGDALDLDRALAALSENERACVVLCYACGLSHAEAAEATGLPLGTVKSHVNRGRERMKALMTKETVTS